MAAPSRKAKSAARRGGVRARRDDEASEPRTPRAPPSLAAMREHLKSQPATQVTKLLWIGNMADARDTAFLRKYDIRHIVNCAGKLAETTATIKRGLTSYVRIDALDAPRYPLLTRHFNEAAEVLDDAHDLNEAVLVHCVMGFNRSVTLALAWLLASGHINDVTAYIDYIRAHRPGALSNTSFVNALHQFQHLCASEGVRKPGK